jgi:hypothetical protein
LTSSATFLIKFIHCHRSKQTYSPWPSIHTAISPLLISLSWSFWHVLKTVSTHAPQFRSIRYWCSEIYSNWCLLLSISLTHSPSITWFVTKLNQI